MDGYSAELDVRMIIRTCYDKMTFTEKSIADYFLSDVPLEDLSPSTLTAKLYVSKASLTRFANRCGFAGYREFVYRYKMDRAMQRDNSSFTSLTQKVIETYQTLFRRTQSLIKESQLRRITQMLICSDRVYLYGSGSSGVAAREFSLRFVRLGMPVEAIDDYLLMKINASVMQPDATVIGMSISGKTRVLLSSLRIAKERGAKVILMTANQSERLAREFDEVLYVASDEMLNAGISISPQFPLLIMGDIIFSYYMHTDLFSKRAIHNHTLEVLNKEKM